MIKKAATFKYHQRIKQVLNTQLNGKNKIHAVHTYIQLAIRFPAAIVSWPKKDLKAVDVRTWKLFTM